MPKFRLTVFIHYSFELFFNRFYLILVLVVARAQISLVVFNDIEIATLRVLTGNNLDLLLTLKSWR